MNYKERLNKLYEGWVGMMSPYAIVRNLKMKGYSLSRIIDEVKKAYPNISAKDIEATYREL